MDKGQRYLWLLYAREAALVMIMMTFLNFAPPMLFAYLFNFRESYWFIAGVWIFGVQLCYYNYTAIKVLKENLKTYNDLMQAVRDATDLHNTEISLQERNELGPN